MSNFKTRFCWWPKRLARHGENAASDSPNMEFIGWVWLQRAHLTNNLNHGWVAFPDRDSSKPAEQQGIFRKFDVRRVDGSDAPGGKHFGCRYFVLDLNHDAHAAAAMRAYAESSKDTHPQLSAEITAEFGNKQSDDAKDAARLDFLDENLRMRMGWSVGKAPAGNISIQSIIQPSGATPIREAIDAAIDALKGGE